MGTVFRSGITNVVGVHIKQAHSWMTSRMEYPDQGFTTQWGGPVACEVMGRVSMWAGCRQNPLRDKEKRRKSHIGCSLD